jgi:hypothetical protein
MWISPDPPYHALTTDLTLTAEQWFDDPGDLPLVYAFYYWNGHQVLNEASWTSMGQETISNVQVWRDPPAGNFTMACRVIDTFGASALVTRTVTVETVRPSLFQQHTVVLLLGSHRYPPFDY